MEAVNVYAKERSGGLKPEKPSIDREFLIKKILQTCSLFGVLGLLLIIAFVVGESMPALVEIGPANLFLSTRWSPDVANPSAGSYGILNFIVGTLYTTLGGLLIGAPLGIGTAIFLTQIAPQAISSVLMRSVEIMNGIPSVIMGWLGLTILVPRIADLTGTSGYGVLAASIILAIMIFPTVTSISSDALRSVPVDYKEASIAIGATRWQTIRRVLIPAAKDGVLIAVILGMGRAIGETMAVQMVVGNARQIAFSLTERTSTLTSRIITDMGESTGVFRSALFVQGLVLLAIAMLLIILVRKVSREQRIRQ